jgi:hypothetical protein
VLDALPASIVTLPRWSRQYSSTFMYTFFIYLLNYTQSNLIAMSSISAPDPVRLSDIYPLLELSCVRCAHSLWEVDNCMCFHRVWVIAVWGSIVVACAS